MKVGFIGLGIMGSRMAANLLASDHELIVYNRTRSKAEPLIRSGAAFADSPCDATADVDVLITMLAGPATIDSLAHGKSGFLGALSSETVWMDCSTVDPAYVRRIADECAKRGIRYLEAPVSGTRVHAENGELIFHVGGTQVDVDAVTPLLKVMGAQINHHGPYGTAASMKLVLNHMMACSMAAFAESVVFAQGLGVDRDHALDVITNSPAAAPFLSAEKEKLKGVEFELDFPLKLLSKDLSLITQSAQDVGTAMPVANCIKEIYKLAERSGYGEEDYTAVYSFLNNPPELAS